MGETRKSISRANSIRRALDHHERRGVVRSWYAYAPGDKRGVRWIVELTGVGTRTFSTRETEALCAGMASSDLAAQRANLEARAEIF